MGSAIKFQEYFVAFGMEWLTPLALFFAVVLCAAELLLGLMLLLGIYKRITAWAVLIFMSFFTVLTFIIMLTDPVSDCGCFGDAVKLSNSATFYKNIIFLGAAVGNFIWNRSGKEQNRFRALISFLLLTAFSAGICIYSLVWLPAVEFLPYKIGVNIPEAMSIPPDAPQSEHETTLIYKDKQTGEEKEFAIEDTTWYDTSRWEYVDTRDKVIKEGFIPAITGFTIMDNRGYDCTEQILNTENLVFVLIIREITPASIESFRMEMEKLYRFAEANGFGFICFTSSNTEDAERYLAEITNIPVVCYNLDETVIKSVVRTEAGVVVLDEGTIVAKWNIRTIPEFDTLQQMEKSFEKGAARQGYFYAAVIFGFVIIAAFYLFRPATKKE